MGRRPLIGVTGPRRLVNPARWAIAWQLRAAGASCRYMAPGSALPNENLDGLIVSGGNDLDPGLYGGEGAHARVDPERDAHEIRQLEAAIEKGLPVLGICRGAQLLNVVAGGTLHADINHLRRRTSRKPHLWPRKSVLVDADSRLHQMLGARILKVNSLHHQAVDGLGKGFRVVARDRDGIVQAIETSSGPLRIGVQWHPEYLPCLSLQRRLFSGLVRAARGLES